MKNLPFLTELTEARMFQGVDNIKGKSAEQISDIVYLIIMMIEVIRRSNPSWASSYASDTMRYNTYENMHYSGTDLANLLAVLNNQDTFKNTIKVDSGISIPLFQVNRYLGAVRSNSNSHHEDATFFWRLEDYLKLYSKSLFRQLRRDIGSWDQLTRADKHQLVQILRREMDRRASSVDIYLWFKQSFKLKESVNEDIDTKLEFHDQLNPKIWDENEELYPDVKDALGKIANKFSEFIDIKQIKIVDYIITGSNCAFNYTDDSDIDLHVLVDTTNLGTNPLTDPFLQAKKALWNSGHDITVKGYTVELYAEDIGNTENQLVATGIYSLLHDKWVKQPEYKKVEIDDYAVQAKAEDIMAQIDSILKDPMPDLNQIQKIWDHIRKMRRSGLAKEGEFSIENLAFKVVRNNGYFTKLKDYEQSVEDDELTLENTNLNEIDAASELPDLFLSQKEIQEATEVGAIDNRRVKKLNKGDEILYFVNDQYDIPDAENTMTAYISVANSPINGYWPLRRVKNISQKPGLISSLLLFAVSKLNMKFVIQKTEPLTFLGKTWLVKLIKSGGRGLKISNQFGQKPTPAEISKAWDATWDSEVANDLEVYLENKNIAEHKASMIINESNLPRMTFFVGDNRLD